MEGLGVWHWIVVIIVVLLLFGRGKVSGLMTEIALGIKAFRNGMREDDELVPTSAKKPSDAPAKKGD